jgi:signal transduction histidine kinase/YHS domain-containing protein
MFTDHNTTHITIITLCGFALALFVVSNLWFYVRVLRPLRQLSQQASQLERGEMDALSIECGGIPEIIRLRRSMAGMSHHIQTALAQTEAYADQLTDGQERERKRLARELHDSTVQSLIAVAQTTELAREWLTSAPDRAAEMLAVARQQAVEAAADLRDLIADLRPPSLEELGLEAAIGLLAQRSALSVTLRVNGIARRLPEGVELALFRVAQEGLTNAQRHSEADNATLTLTYAPEGVTLIVADGGRGFSVAADLRRYALTGHYGLMGLRERITNLGGTVQVTSAVGKGTQIQAHIPSEAVRAADILHDPVCGMDIATGQAYATLTHEGTEYGFCCPVCKGAFERAPERYLMQNPS